MRHKRAIRVDPCGNIQPGGNTQPGKGSWAEDEEKVSPSVFKMDSETQSHSKTQHFEIPATGFLH